MYCVQIKGDADRHLQKKMFSENIIKIDLKMAENSRAVASKKKKRMKNGKQ